MWKWDSYRIISKHPMLKLILIANSSSSVRSNFKTSHVKVNPFSLYKCCWPHSISKHPMLKLIPSFATFISSTTDFKTSHVKVNQCTQVQTTMSSRISKHPMLKLIGLHFFKHTIKIFISKHPMLKLILCFFRLIHKTALFQNIPC